MKRKCTNCDTMMECISVNIHWCPECGSLGEISSFRIPAEPLSNLSTEFIINHLLARLGYRPSEITQGAIHFDSFRSMSVRA